VIEQLLAAENLLSLGLLDQAERTYRQVLAADPRNAIAAVGLSRVALERGDEPAAIALARDALAIDPENATARRMIDRLEEVARHREVAAAAAAPAAPEPAVVAPEPAAAATEPPAAPGPPEPPTAPGPAPDPDETAPPGEPPPSTSPRDRPGPAPARPGFLRRLLRRT
jgi:tetratricopeptide (TPR) repeat protein